MLAAGGCGHAAKGCDEIGDRQILMQSWINLDFVRPYSSGTGLGGEVRDLERQM